MNEAIQPLKLLIATKNPGKTEEVRSLLRELPLDLHSLVEFSGIPTVDESGSSYAENATLKASIYARNTGMWALADDSGLEVDALQGAPGVISARYAGEGATDSQRLKLVLSRLSQIEGASRSARFHSVVALVNAQGRLMNLAEGICEGAISEEPRGHNGFGYDPIFVPRGYGLTFGEMPAKEKDRISHRARALRATKQFLIQLLRPLDRC